MPSTTIAAGLQPGADSQQLENTSSVAVMTFEKKEMPNTLSEKLRWKYARAAPSNASNASNTIIRQIRLELDGDVRTNEYTDYHADDKSQDSCHYLSFLTCVVSPATAASSVIDLLLLICG